MLWTVSLARSVQVEVVGPCSNDLCFELGLIE